jgi:hypothetical protein
MSILIRHTIYVIDQDRDSVLTKQIESNCKNNQLTSDNLKEGPRRTLLFVKILILKEGIPFESS